MNSSDEFIELFGQKKALTPDLGETTMPSGFQKTQMKTNRLLATIAALTLAAAAAQGASSIVYSNATTYTGSILNPGLSQVGDEINLGPGGRFGELFRFEYYGLNFDGDETVLLRFYNNDGADLGNGTSEPGSVFYDSLVQLLPAPTDPSGRNSLQYDLDFVALPERFTFAVSFTGILGDDVVGLSLYHPMTVGFSEDDFWFNEGTILVPSWDLRGTNVPINFGASLVATTVPEPSTYVLAIIGGLCGLALVNRRKRDK